MIVKRLIGTKVEQSFVSDVRLITNDWDEDPTSIVLELDFQPNDPRYKGVKLKLTGEVTFIRKDKVA